MKAAAANMAKPPGGIRWVRFVSGRPAVRRSANLSRRAAAGAGMTLIEVLLAASIVAGLMLGVLTFYGHVTDVRDSFLDQLRQVETTAARRAFMDQITDELRGAMVYPFLRFGMTGGTDQIQFVTATLPGPAAWAVRQRTDDPIPPEHDLVIVGYHLLIVEDDRSQPVIVGLERTRQKIMAAETAQEGEEIEATLIAPQFKFIAFNYWDNQAAQWLPAWDSSDLPTAVEIVLGINPLPENVEPQDYPYATFRRTVFIPGAVQALTTGTVVRGLQGARP